MVAWEDIPGRQFDFVNTEQVLEHLIELPMPLAPHEHMNCFEGKSLLALRRLAGLTPIR